MGILDGIKEKAQSLMGTASGVLSRKTGVYDASKNSVRIAGCSVDGIVSMVLSAESITVAEQGVDSSYYTYYDVVEPRTFSMEVLPTAKCHQVIRLLAKKQQESKGWFHIVIYENGDLVNSFRGHLMNLPDVNMQQEAGNKTYVFGIKLVGATTKVVDQTSESSPVGINDTAIQLQKEADELNITEN